MLCIIFMTVRKIGFLKKKKLCCTDEEIGIMGSKMTSTTTPETTPKEPKAEKEIRNHLLSTGFVKNDEQIPKRPESTVSRQFLPRKKYGINEVWSKQMQESVRF